MFKKLSDESNELKADVVNRPWGRYVVLDTVYDRDELIHKQKLLIVAPNTVMQLHKHVNYTELWIGESEFDYIVEDADGNMTVRTAKPFERIFVPKDRKHQIISKTVELRIFEVQTGSIIDDDNIKFD